MTWTNRPANWDKPGHLITGGENEEILDQIEMLSNATGISNVTGSGTNTGAYSNIPGTSSLTFTKLRAATTLRIDLAFQCYSTATATKLTVAVLISGTDYGVVEYRFEAANDHRQVVGTRYVTGLAAGSYTVQARWGRSTGAGTLTCNADDWITLSCAEVSG